MALNKSGRYLQVNLMSDSGRFKSVRVHQLVALVFCGPKPPFPCNCALHKDDNPRNNRADNLYWGTNSRNSHDAIRNGSFRFQAEKLERKSFKGKLYKHADKIRSLYTTNKFTIGQLARRYGVHRQTIGSLILGYTYRQWEDEMAKWSKAERDLHFALCNFCNDASDPYEPVNKWNEGVKQNFKRLCKAYNAWYSWMKESNGDHNDEPLRGESEGILKD